MYFIYVPCVRFYIINKYTCPWCNSSDMSLTLTPVWRHAGLIVTSSNSNAVGEISNTWLTRTDGHTSAGTVYTAHNIGWLHFRLSLWLRPKAELKLNLRAQLLSQPGLSINSWAEWKFVYILRASNPLLISRPPLAVQKVTMPLCPRKSTIQVSSRAGLSIHFSWHYNRKLSAILKSLSLIYRKHSDYIIRSRSGELQAAELTWPG